VVWWEKGYYPQENEAPAEIVAAFEQETGKQVELVFHEIGEAPEAILAALEVDQPPDFAFALRLRHYLAQWALADRLVDLTDTVGFFSDLFDPDMLARGSVRNPETGQKALYGLPIGRSTNYLHVWNSLMEQSGFALGDIPKEWEAFWSFWCDQVQPAARKVMRRDDLWGIALNLSGEAGETDIQFMQFANAYEANYVTRDGELIIDDPEIRRRLIRAVSSYTAPYRKGCTPRRSGGTTAETIRRSWRGRSS
jgi:multiple sugar transport system substrate-binding protein